MQSEESVPGHAEATRAFAAQGHFVDPREYAHDSERKIAVRIQQLWFQWGSASLELELAIGRVIVEGLHRGRAAAWRKRRKTDPSLRRISNALQATFAQDGFGSKKRSIGPSQLYYAVSAYVLVQTFPHVLNLEHLKASHFHAVAGLPDADAVALLERASRERLGASVLHRKASQVRPRGKGGRPPKPEALRQLERVASTPLPPASVDVAALLEGIPPAARRELVSGLWRIGSRCSEIGAAIARAARSQVRVLVVTEDQLLRVTAEQWLVEAGYCLAPGATAWEGVLALPAGSVDLVILDVPGKLEPSFDLARGLIDAGRMKRVVFVAQQAGSAAAEPVSPFGTIIDRSRIHSDLQGVLAMLEMDLAGVPEDAERVNLRRKRL